MVSTNASNKRSILFTFYYSVFTFLAQYKLNFYLESNHRNIFLFFIGSTVDGRLLLLLLFFNISFCIFLHLSPHSTFFVPLFRSNHFGQERREKPMNQNNMQYFIIYFVFVFFIVNILLCTFAPNIFATYSFIRCDKT